MASQPKRFSLLIQSFISPRGRDVAAIDSVVAEFETYRGAQQAAALIEALPADAYPHTKVLRLYPLEAHLGD